MNTEIPGLNVKYWDVYYEKVHDLVHGPDYGHLI